MLYLQGITWQLDKDIANSICYLIDKTTYDKYMDKARKMVTERASSTYDLEVWKVFCTYFREGPIARAIPKLDKEHQEYSPWKRLWVD